MEVTDVRLTKKVGEDRMEAYGSITLDGDFVINGIKVMRSKEGNLYVSYPSRRNQQGDYKDICYPMTQTLREDIHIKVMAKYEEL
ncbi:stage V sporulation protein G [Lachnospiraceae bacterium A10]|jgi:stage V sporulation protein G|nr:stage V sporulation protein G [Lachnospiraceae bacterium A10]